MLKIKLIKKENIPMVKGQRNKDYRELIEIERERLINITDYDAIQLPTDEKYQRMRYLREIEGMGYVEKRRPTVPEKIIGYQDYSEPQPSQATSLRFWGPGNPDYDRMSDECIKKSLKK